MDRHEGPHHPYRAEIDQRHAEEGRVFAEGIYQITQIDREAFGGCGDGCGEAGGQCNRGAYESQGLPIGLADIDIFRAGAGQHRAELGKAQGAAKCEHATENPEPVDQAGVAQIGGLKTGRGENPRADHVRDDQPRCRSQTDKPSQPLVF